MLTAMCFVIMLVCISFFDSVGDITRPFVVFCVCAAWVAVFLFANREYMD